MKLNEMSNVGGKLFILLAFTFLISCVEEKTNEDTIYVQEYIESDIISNEVNLLSDVVPINKEGVINAIIEIPAGTMDKWELDKNTGEIVWEKVNNVPRVVNYIGYPGNYGLIPQTLLSKENGGDGDPLDVLVLGPAVKRGTIASCKIIGVLHLKDNGEKDDKLIAVSYDSPFYRLRSMEELNSQYKGVSNIVKTWFSNYKGPGKTKVSGYGTKEQARKILKMAMEEYKSANP
ncbi:MAG: inorganic pyrophosphatase [Patiriisocius sp.]|jgi:inorganic pyrophosphatase